MGGKYCASDKTSTAELVRKLQRWRSSAAGRAAAVALLCTMRYLLILLGFLLLGTAQAGPPRLLLDVARFRNLNKVEKGAEVEIYVTVPTNSLTYRQRAPKAFQAAASVTLDIVNAASKSIYHEVITLKPPVQNDTTMAIKNGLSFLRRIMIPDGNYTLRATVSDKYRTAHAELVVEKSLVLAGPATPFLSDIVLLARPAVKNNGDNDFNRGGFLLTPRSRRAIWPWR